jgi:DNA-binding NtrC family response regulator
VSPPSQLRDLLDRIVSAMIDGHITFDEGRRAFEARFIEHALTKCDGHLSNTADRLGLHRNTLARKMVEYRLRAK